MISQIILGGILKYYGFEGDAKILINGSSMSMTGFDRKSIEAKTKFKTAFYAREGVNVEERYVMLQHYFSEHPKAVKTVIYEINPLLLSKTATAKNVYTIFYPFIDNEFIRRYIGQNEAGMDYLIHRYIRCTRFDAQLLVTSMRGFFGNYEIYKTNVVDSLELSHLRSMRDQTLVSLNPERMKTFEASMKLIKDNKADIILIVMPMVNEKTLSFTANSYSEYYKYFQNFSETNAVRFVDFNLKEVSNDPTLFSDPLHLNYNGQKKVTTMVINLLLKESN